VDWVRTEVRTGIGVGGDYASMLGHARRSERRGFEGWRVNFSKAATMAWAARDLVGA
jgi:hypothetical protein